MGKIGFKGVFYEYVSAIRQKAYRKNLPPNIPLFHTMSVVSYPAAAALNAVPSVDSVDISFRLVAKD
jgi:hypothetical protein